jgi:hypothetical protein
MRVKKEKKGFQYSVFSEKIFFDIWVYFKSFTLIFKTSLILPLPLFLDRITESNENDGVAIVLEEVLEHLVTN